MRLPIAPASLALLFVQFALVQAAEPSRTFPYRTYVTADDVYVRSGPGENYYPTEKLKTGDEVEVYRHDPGGWYAIRPLPNSFSWVAGRHVQLGNNNVATVTEDRVAARVGSRFSDVRDVIQVRLHRGELVEVIDAKRDGPATGNPSNTWYKISPPSGEFRWVAGKYLDANFSRDGLRRTQGERRGPLGELAAVDAAYPRTMPDQRRDIDRAEAEQYETPPAVPRTMSAAQFQAEVSELDLELSTMVAEEPTVWQFGELRQRAQSLLSQAETAVERGKARVLTSKIARFDDIKQRYDRVNALHDETERTERQLARVSPRPRGVSPQLDADNRFDGVGTLTRVTSPKTGAPQYALLDASGRVACYVTPAPGVNLRYYLGRQVGINGTRGYVPEQQTSHLMAQHISAIDEGALR